MNIIIQAELVSSIVSAMRKAKKAGATDTEVAAAVNSAVRAVIPAPTDKHERPG